MNTERSIAIVLFAGLFCVLCLPAWAATCDPSAGYFCNPLNTGGDGADTFADFVILAIQALLSIVGAVSLAFLIVGGIRYITAAGSQESMASAKNTVTSALLGLVLCCVAYGIVLGLEEIMKRSA
jgi:hypothetical protein